MSLFRRGFLAWLGLTLAALLFAFDRVPPDRFIHSWLWIILLASLAFFLLIAMLKRKISITLGLSRNQKFAILAVVVLLIAGAIYFPRILNEKALIKEAAADFDVIIHGEIARKQVDYTMLQLEKGLTRVVDASSLGSTRLSAIRVELYPDITELQRITGLEDWAAGFTLYTPTGPVIYIPVVMDESGSNETPEHEVVHAVMYQQMGRQIEKLPQWFREGMAQYISEMGFFKLPARDITRLHLWFDKDLVISAGDFNAYSPDNPSASEQEIRFFYDSAHEFVRYLTGVYGSDLPWRITAAVTGGSSFEQAMAGVTGKSYSGCYADWQKVFWGISS